MRRRIRLLVLCALSVQALFLLVSCGSGGDSDRSAVPRVESTACKHTLRPDSTTQCGYLVVPQDRSVADGKTIKLYFANFKNPSSTPSEPVFYLTGGPGASTASAYSVFENNSAGNYITQNFGDNRDIIVIDQRGTNSAKPALYCSQELGPLRDQVYGISFRAASDLRIQALGQCYARLKREGVDLSDYNTLENAADVDDLRKVLGYDTINVYSASYGTRLAMSIMKHFPGMLKSVVLDSILPPEINPFEKETLAVLYSFRSLFDAAKDAYPDLETHFYAMVDALANNPHNVTGHHYDSQGNAVDTIMVNVTGDKLVSYLVAQLKQTPYNTGLPQQISAMYTSGDYSPVADAWISNIDFFFPDSASGSDAPSIGMYDSIFSAQDSFYTSPDKIQQVIAENVTNPSLAYWLQNQFIYSEPGIMGVWPVKPLPYSESDPVVSDIPTLMLVGSLDNATPAIFSEPSAAFLSNSYYFTILAGHATAYLECVDQMIDGFIKDPAVSPADTCPTEYQWL
jgi:pimeloyl-ACP methyl ester carboxylesterase